MGQGFFRLPPHPTISCIQQSTRTCKLIAPARTKRFCWLRYSDCSKLLLLISMQFFRRMIISAAEPCNYGSLPGSSSITDTGYQWHIYDRRCTLQNLLPYFAAQSSVPEGISIVQSTRRASCIPQAAILLPNIVLSVCMHAQSKTDKQMHCPSTRGNVFHTPDLIVPTEEGGRGRGGKSLRSSSPNILDVCLRVQRNMANSPHMHEPCNPCNR